jgi:hypothetical protein
VSWVIALAKRTPFDDAAKAVAFIVNSPRRTFVPALPIASFAVAGWFPE